MKMGNRVTAVTSRLPRDIMQAFSLHLFSLLRHRLEQLVVVVVVAAAAGIPVGDPLLVAQLQTSEIIILPHTHSCPPYTMPMGTVCTSQAQAAAVAA